MTDLEVSRIAFGTWQLGGDRGRCDEAEAINAIRYARSLGVNFLDTAQAYGFGASERLLGRALGDELVQHRDQLVIATKGGLRMAGQHQVRDSSPAWLRQGVEESLGRNVEKVRQLERFAAERGHSVSQLAIAWTLARPDVDVAIVGSRPAAHIEDSLGAFELRLTTEDLAAIDRIMAGAVPVGGPSPESV